MSSLLIAAIVVPAWSEVTVTGFGTLRVAVPTHLPSGRARKSWTSL